MVIRAVLDMGRDTVWDLGLAGYAGRSGTSSSFVQSALPVAVKPVPAEMVVRSRWRMRLGVRKPERISGA